MSYISKEAMETMPKRTPNSFFLFRSDHYDALKAKNQDKTMTELTKIIGEMWSDLDEKRKNEYNKRVEEGKEEQIKEYAAWLKKYKLDEDKTKAFLKSMKDQKAQKKKERTKKSKSEDDEDEVPKKQVLKKGGKAKNTKMSDEEENDSESEKHQEKQKGKDQPKQTVKETSKQPKQQKDQKDHKEVVKDQPKQPAARRKSQGKKGA